MDLLKLSKDSSFLNDLIYDSSIIEINEASDSIEAPLDCHFTLDRSFSSSSTSLSRRQVTTDNLDITRISDRLLVISRCWPSDYISSNERSINNLEDLAKFLNSKYRDKYLIWNIGTPESVVSPLPFNNRRIIPFSLPKSQHFSLKTLFHLCHSMLGWLQLSPENVVLIQCNNGWNRSGLMVSCLLKFCGAVDSTFDAMNLFQSRRLKTKSITIDMSDSMSVITRYLKYFNDTIQLSGRVPNPTCLNLHQIIISTIPNFDGSGNCFPGLEIFQNNESSKGSKNEIYLFKDEFNIIFKLNDEVGLLERDITLHLFHTHPQTGQRSTILNFTFNTAFSHPGVVRLRAEDLEMPLKDVSPPSIFLYPGNFCLKSGKGRFQDNFHVDLILLPTSNSQDSLVDYSSTIRNNFAKNLLRLSQLHPIRPDRRLLSPLLQQGYPKFYIKLALQLYNNDIHRAHEFLTKLGNENSLKDIEGGLLELTLKPVDANLDANDSAQIFSNVAKEEHTPRILDETLQVPRDIIDNFKPQVPVNEVLEDSADSSAEEEHDSHQINVDESILEEYKVDEAVKDAEQVNGSLELNSPVLESTNTKEPLHFKAPLPSYSGIGLQHEEVKVFDAPKPPVMPIFLNNSKPISSGSIPPPPPPPPPPFIGKIPMMPAKPAAPKPRIKNSLFWNELIVDNESGESSVWREIAEEKFKLNTEKFEELFCVSVNGQSTKTTSKEQEEKVNAANDIPIVIDIRRANNVGIGLARFNRRFSSFDALVSAVFDESKLNLDDLFALRSILPTLEESNNLNLIKESDSILLSRMGRSEQFLYFVSTKFGFTLGSAIDMKIFQKTSWQDLTVIKQKFEIISGVLDNLKSCCELKVILKAALEIGNLATNEYGKYKSNVNSSQLQRKNSIIGFTLDSLCKLHEVKSVDGRSNLLIFLCGSLKQLHPEVLNLPNDERFKDLELIRGWSNRQMMNEFEELESFTERMLFELNENDEDYGNAKQDFINFKRDSKTKLEKFKETLISTRDETLSHFTQTWNETQSYFGQSDNTSGSASSSIEIFEDVSKFMTTMWQFFRNFDSAVKVEQETSSKRKQTRTKTDSKDSLKSNGSSSSSSSFID